MRLIRNCAKWALVVVFVSAISCSNGSSPSGTGSSRNETPGSDTGNADTGAGNNSDSANRGTLDPEAPNSATPIPANSPGSPLLNDVAKLSTTQKNKIEEIANIFENSTPDFQYGYIEDIGDGAGITAGRVGFNLGAGDLQTVVYDYVKAKNNHTPLANPDYLSCLQHYHGTQSYDCLFPSVDSSTLENADFRSGTIATIDFGLAWTNAANDPIMQQLQDTLVEQEIFLPSVELAKGNGIKTALGLAVVYDTVLQQGPGGFAAILRRTKNAYRAIHAGVTTPAEGADEIEWLNLFLQDRIDTLRYGFNSKDVRNKTENSYVSYPRAVCLLTILKSGNLHLNDTIVIDYFGDHFELTK